MTVSLACTPLSDSRGQSTDDFIISVNVKNDFFGGLKMYYYAKECRIKESTGEILRPFSHFKLGESLSVPVF